MFRKSGTAPFRLKSGKCRNPFRAVFVLCWNGSTWKWPNVGACRFGHHGVEAVEQGQAGDSGESGVAAHVPKLREALAKLAATVMWGSSARAALEVQFVERTWRSLKSKHPGWRKRRREPSGTTCGERGEPGARCGTQCTDRAVNAPIDQTLQHTQVHVVEKTLEKTVEILQVTVH